MISLKKMGQSTGSSEHFELKSIAMGILGNLGPVSVSEYVDYINLMPQRSWLR